MKLAQLHAPTWLDDELKWFYANGRGAIGLRSSFGAFYTRMQLGYVQMTVDTHAHAMGQATAIDRSWSIARALRRISAEERSILHAAYEPIDWSAKHRSVWLEFGLLTGVAVRCEVAKASYMADSKKRTAPFASVTDWLEGVCNRAIAGGRDDSNKIYEIKIDAWSFYRPAIAAYRSVRSAKKAKEQATDE